jgi:hypothetical protein
MTREKFIGAWKLVSAEYRRKDGGVIEYLGEKPLGMLVYTADGHMSVHLERRDRPMFATDDRLGGTPEEIRAAFQGYLGYYGTFAVDEAQGTVTHHLEACSFPNWNGVDQKRFYQLAGDHLMLRTPPLLIKGEQVEGHLVWRRAKENV